MHKSILQNYPAGGLSKSPVLDPVEPSMAATLSLGTISDIIMTDHQNK